MKQGKIGTSVTLCSFDLSVPNLVWFLLECQFWLNLVGWGTPRQ